MSLNSRTVLGHTVPELNAIVRRWQRGLRLLDWNVQLEVLDPREMPVDDADVLINNDRRIATIRIAADCNSEQELHDNIVHELLHLHFYFIEPGTVQGQLVEHAIHSISPLVAKLFLA